PSAALPARGGASLYSIFFFLAGRTRRPIHKKSPPPPQTRGFFLVNEELSDKIKLFVTNDN
ncbi:hypothetical protein, partial [Klebsiella pneumoniae]|uniref:hypothetical protein n=1 Tax=Klebsiella pneumoniae TaxID=573 RepID=UPI001C83B36A